MSTEFFIQEFSECKSEWDEFVSKSDEAWFWHTSMFLEAWPYGENVSFAIKNSQNEIILEQILFFIKNQKVSFKQIIHSGRKSNNYFQSVGGLARKNELSAKNERELARFYIMCMDDLIKKYKISYFNYSIQATLPKAYWPDKGIMINPMIFFGYKNVMSQSYVIDLSQEMDIIFKSYSQTTRNLINRCRKEKNIKIVEAQSTINDMELYYKLHVETYLRTGVKPHPKSYFQHIFFDILPLNLCHILFLYNGENLIAAHNILLFKESAMYWTGASATEKGEGESRLLMHTQIAFAKSCGCKYFEIGEAFPNERIGKLKGLNDFKKSFGGFMHPIFSGEYKIMN